MTRWILGVALVAGLVRFVFLGKWSLWIDEAYTLADAMGGRSAMNPLGYWVFGWFYGLAEQRPDEFMLRLPSAVLGWLCIPLTAWGLAPFVGRRPAAIAALVIALSPWHIYWSQNARFYTAAQAACLLGSRLLFQGLCRSGAVRVLLGIACFGVAGAFHPSAAMFVGAMLLVPWGLRFAGAWPAVPGDSICRAPRDAGPAWWTLLAISCALGAGALVWAPGVWGTWNSRQGVGSPMHFIKTAGYLVSPALGMGLAVGAWCVLRRRMQRASVLLWTVVVGLAGALGASVFARVSAQYVFVFLPYIAALAALPGAPRAASSGQAAQAARRSWRIAYLAFLTLPLLLESGLYFTVRHGDRPRWRDAYRYVFEHREENDLVLGMEVPVGEYYLNPRSVELRDHKRLAQLDSYNARVPTEWTRYGRRIWLVVNASHVDDWSDSQREDYALMLGVSRRVAEFPIPYTPRAMGVEVFLFDGRP